MHRLAPILQEFFDLRLRAQRGDQLEAALPNRDHRDLDPLGLETLSSGRAQPEPAFVQLDRLVEIANRDADVIDPAQHGLIVGVAAGRTRRRTNPPRRVPRLDRVCTLCGRVEHGQSRYGSTPSLYSGF